MNRRSRPETNPPDGTSTGEDPAVSNNLPIPPNPGSYHGWAKLLAMLDRIRAIAHDRSLDDADMARRIRDLFLDYDQPEAADDA
jgi:hypothetical protein